MEQQVKDKGLAVKTSVLPLDAAPRAINRETTGVFKLVADKKTFKVVRNLCRDRKCREYNLFGNVNCKIWSSLKGKSSLMVFDRN